MGSVICKQYGFVPTNFCARFPSVSLTYMNRSEIKTNSSYTTALQFGVQYLVTNTFWSEWYCIQWSLQNITKSWSGSRGRVLERNDGYSGMRNCTLQLFTEGEVTKPFYWWVTTRKLDFVQLGTNSAHHTSLQELGINFSFSENLDKSTFATKFPFFLETHTMFLPQHSV